MNADLCATPIAYVQLDRTIAERIRHAEIFDGEVLPDQLSRFIQDPNHEMIVAMHEDEPVGFASGCVLLHPDKRPVFFVSEVGVEPRFRRQGVGGELMTRLVELARKRGCKGIWLATEPDNIAARALYRSLAARETENIVVYDWDGAMDP